MPRVNPDFTHYEYIVFRRLQALSKQGSKPCVYSDKQGSIEFNCSEVTIRRAITGLHKKGLIRDIKRISKKAAGLKGHGNIRCLWVQDCRDGLKLLESESHVS